MAVSFRGISSSNCTCGGGSTSGSSSSSTGGHLTFLKAKNFKNKISFSKIELLLCSIYVGESEASLIQLKIFKELSFQEESENNNDNIVILER